MGADSEIVGSYALYVDDITVYSGNEDDGFYEVWWDNFEDYMLGDLLDPSDDPYSIYDSYSAEVVVAEK